MNVKGCVQMVERVMNCAKREGQAMNDKGQYNRSGGYGWYQQGQPQYYQPQQNPINHQGQFSKKPTRYQHVNHYDYNNYHEQHYSQSFIPNRTQQWIRHQLQPEKINDQSFRSNTSYQTEYEGESSTWDNVGRFGKFDDPAKKKKKKKKKKPKVEPPQPKPKVPCMAQIRANQGLFVTTQKYIQTAVCPFNPAHLMPQKSLLTHINRCKHSQYARGYQMCKYNPTHYTRQSLLELHQMECPNRVKSIEELMLTRDEQEVSDVHAEKMESMLIQDNRWIVRDDYMEESVREYEYALLRDF